MSFVNPAPVAVVLVPVGSGLLAIRRGIHPGFGELALPGGFLEVDETWQEGAAREVWEETGLRLEPVDLRLFSLRSLIPEGLLIIFALANEISPAALPPFVPNVECTERTILEAPGPLAFPLHEEAVAAYFAR
jgi:8-oxo-dGTP pyrophosphatase MutT (NUDIX family)